MEIGLEMQHISNGRRFRSSKCYVSLIRPRKRFFISIARASDNTRYSNYYGAFFCLDRFSISTTHSTQSNGRYGSLELCTCIYFSYIYVCFIIDSCFQCGCRSNGYIYSVGLLVYPGRGRGKVQCEWSSGHTETTATLHGANKGMRHGFLVNQSYLPLFHNGSLMKFKRPS